MCDKKTDILFLDKNIRNKLKTLSEDDNIGYKLPDDIKEENLSSSFKTKLLRKENELINSIHFYEFDTLEIMDEYTTNLQKPIKITFRDNQFVEDNDMNIKKEIINEYFEKIREYSIDEVLREYDIDRVSKHKRSDSDTNNLHIDCKKKCKRCDSENMTESVECTSTSICIDCGYQETNLSLVNNFKINHNDSKRINICPKYSYEKKSHFINTINQFQGKTDNKRNESIDIVIETLKKEIKKYNIFKNKKNIKTITKEHIYLFLKDLNCTQYYNHINYIYHKITGIPLNDISHLTEKLLQDFDQFVQMHYKLYPGKNFNYQFLLFQLLMRHKYQCSLNDFNLLKTTERKVLHEHMCKHVFEELGWNYVSIF